MSWCFCCTSRIADVAALRPQKHFAAGFVVVVVADAEEHLESIHTRHALRHTLHLSLLVFVVAVVL